MTQLEALRAIADRNGGLITPAAVVEDARNPESALHGAFEWDDTVASEKYRIVQAQHLIRTMRVTVEENGRKFETYAFIGVSVDRTDGSANNPYRRAEDVAKSGDLMAIAEKDALDQLNALRKRHEHLKRLGDIWAAIDRHLAG